MKVLLICPTQTTKSWYGIIFYTTHISTCTFTYIYRVYRRLFINYWWNMEWFALSIQKWSNAICFCHTNSYRSLSFFLSFYQSKTSIDWTNWCFCVCELTINQEHPILLIPFYHIHPCQTSKLMLLIEKRKNYLLSWLSIFGPILGLNISLSTLASYLK
jgi:hypothetical protein